MSTAAVAADRPEAAESAVLRAGARLSRRGRVSLAELASAAGLAKGDAMAAVDGLTARGGWPFGDPGEVPAFVPAAPAPVAAAPRSQDSAKAASEARILAAAAELAKAGPFLGVDLVAASGLGHCAARGALKRLRDRGEWPHDSPPSGRGNRGHSPTRAPRGERPGTAPRRKPAFPTPSGRISPLGKPAAPGPYKPPPGLIHGNRGPEPVDKDEARAACDRLRSAWRAYRRGEKGPLLAVAGLIRPQEMDARASHHAIGGGS